MPNDPKKYPIGFKFVTRMGHDTAIEHEVIGLWDDGTYRVTPGVCAEDRWISDQIGCWVETSWGKKIQDNYYQCGDANTHDYPARDTQHRVKTEVRRWLDRVVGAAIEVAAKAHPNKPLGNQWTQKSLRKRIAGSISDGLQRKLECGDLFGQDDSGKVRCIICKKALQIEDADAPVTLTDDGRISNQIVYDGVDCVAYGNYGSSAWDPMDRVPLLGFVLCDPCFRKRKHRMYPIVREKGRTDEQQEAQEGNTQRGPHVRAAEHGDQRSEAESGSDGESSRGAVQYEGSGEGSGGEDEAARGDDRVSVEEAEGTRPDGV